MIENEQLREMVPKLADMLDDAVCATGRYKTSEAYTAALTVRRYLARRQTLPDQRGSASDRGPLP
jgi:hypothetical protein